MRDIINKIVEENYRGAKDIISEHSSNLIELSKALKGEIPFNNVLIYKMLYIMNEDHGTCDIVFDLLRKCYFRNKIDIFLQSLECLCRLHNLSISNVRIAREQIEDYEKIYGWKINDRFLFPCNGSGIYAMMVIYHLMNYKEIIEVIPDEYNRYKHIIENQIYVVEKEAINNFCFSFVVDTDNEFNKNIYTGDFLSFKYDCYRETLLKNILFTASFGDAPVFTERLVEKRTKNYIYHKYINKSILLSKKTCLLSPSRWFQTDTSELWYLKKFREMVMKSDHARLLNYFEVKNDITNTGGLSYMIYDIDYKGECFFKKNNDYADLKKADIILKDSNLYKLLEKLMIGNRLSNTFFTSGWAYIKSNDKRLSKKEEKDTIKVHVSKKYGYINFITKQYLTDKMPHGFNMWKVLVKETISIGVGMNNTFRIAKPGELCTQTFCGFLVHSENEAISLISYLNTNFVNKIILMRKIKNHINKHCLSYLPAIPLDREWTDDKIIEYLKINSQEKQIIYG